MQELQNQEGFVDNIFLYLWMQDPVMNQVPNVKIPDTVIIRNNQIFQWYFYCGKQIKKKSKNKLTRDYLKEQFLKQVPKSGIVALWIQKKQSIDKNQQEVLTYNYLDKQEFINFIKNYDPNEIVEGVLQKFVQPKGEQNSVLRVQWSNNLCFFEKIQNPKKLNDKNLDKYQRILTYEIPNTHSEIIQLKGTFLITSLETIANNIKQHIVNLSFERFKITRMNLIFKVIEDNSIIFMGCTNIKLEDRKLQNHNSKQEKNSQAIVTIPPNIDTSKLGLYQTSNLKQENQCSSCLKMINDFATYMAKLKSVIQSWEFDHDGKKQLIIDQEKQEILNEQFQSKEQHNKNVASFKSNTNFYQRIQQSQIFIDVERAYNIPKVIRNIMPKIKEEKYLQLKENPGFNDTEVQVCEQCYLDIMSNCNIYESIEKLTKQVGRLDEFHGIGRLKPEQLNLRYNLTRRNIKLQEILDSEDIESLKLNKLQQTQYSTKNWQSQQINSPLTSAFYNTSYTDNLNNNYSQKKNQQLLDKVGLKSQTRSDFYLNNLKNAKSLPSIQQYQNITKFQKDRNQELNLEQQLKIKQKDPILILNSSNNENIEVQNHRNNEEIQQNGNNSQTVINSKTTKNQQTQERYQFQAKKDENYNDKTTINNTHNLSTNQTSLLQYNWDQNQLTDPTSINNLEKPNPRRQNQIVQQGIENSENIKYQKQYIQTEDLNSIEDFQRNTQQIRSHQKSQSLVKLPSLSNSFKNAKNNNQKFQKKSISRQSKNYLKQKYQQEEPYDKNFIYNQHNLLSMDLKSYQEKTKFFQKIDKKL